jgi:cell division protein FtsQ
MNALMRLVLWLLALAMVALPVVAVLGGWVGAERWPLARLRVHAPMTQVPAEQVQQLLLPYARAGYFAVDLQQAQDTLEQLPWVESAKVHKQWPDVLEVTLTEHQPLARWGEDRLLSVQGKLIDTPQGLDVSALPDLGGPDTQTTQVVELYQFANTLFAGHGQQLQRVRMDARGSWELRLDGGIDVVVGRHDARSRLQRFARVLPQLAASQKAPIARADLRYTNGFTLSWGNPAAAKTTQDRT